MTPHTLHYFCYGSNLHPVRLQERIPSAQLITTSAIQGYRVLFHKLSDDQSTKCNLFHTGYEQDQAYGAIYTMDATHKPVLDEYEGEGYACCDISVTTGQQEFHCFTYIAQDTHITTDILPYHWYKELVLLGARYLNFPEQYIQHLDTSTTMPDPNAQRHQDRMALIARMKDY